MASWLHPRGRAVCHFARRCCCCTPRSSSLVQPFLVDKGTIRRRIKTEKIRCGARLFSSDSAAERSIGSSNHCHSRDPKKVIFRELKNNEQFFAFSKAYNLYFPEEIYNRFEKRYCLDGPCSIIINPGGGKMEKERTINCSRRGSLIRAKISKCSKYAATTPPGVYFFFFSSPTPPISAEDMNNF